MHRPADLCMGDAEGIASLAEILPRATRGIVSKSFQRVRFLLALLQAQAPCLSGPFCSMRRHFLPLQASRRPKKRLEYG